MQPQKRHNLRYTMTLSLALAGLTTAGGVLLYRAENARAQDEPPVELPQPIDQNTPEEPLPPFIPQPDPRDLVPVQPQPQPGPDIQLPPGVLPPDFEPEAPE